jgi:DNA (cytosine-5)-methyltransferase 1
LKPAVVLLENVKNLQAHDEGRTFETIKKALQGEAPDPAGNLIEEGYVVDQVVLNAVDFGVPQNRERIFIVAFRDREVAANFTWPKGRTANRPVRSLNEYIDFNGEIGLKYHYERNPIFTRLDTAMVNDQSIYQWRRHYVRENKSGVCPTLTANMGMGGHNVPLVRTKTGIRRLTPQECFSLMGMPDIKTPDELADSRLYKQAGNAVVVPVLEAIALEIWNALESAKN